MRSHMDMPSRETGMRLISKIGVVTVMIIFCGLLLGWPLYNWLAL